MATKKQRKRSQKGRRHEYETVWVDSEGNELEEPPDDVGTQPAREAKVQAKPSRQPSRGGRPAPLPPSWRRSIRRALMLGAVIVVLFALLNSKHGASGLATALLLGVVYTGLFVPFTYYLDRVVYRRWERKAGEQPKKR
jgi:hypothetical protein